MKRFLHPLVTMLLLLAAGLLQAPAHAWVSLGESESASYFVAPELMRAQGAQRRVWRLFEYKHKQDSGVRSGKALIEIDCKEGTYRYLRTLYYAGSMGQGQVLGGSREQHKEFIGPGTMIAQLAQAVCAPAAAGAPVAPAAAPASAPRR